MGNYQSKFHLLGGPLDRLLIATHALWFYAGKVFGPVNLIFSYPRWEINAGDWRQYLWLAGCLAVAVALWLTRGKLGRASAAALIFFVAVLSPMLGFIPLYTFYFSYVADHYQYFACLGLIVLAVGSGLTWFSRWGINPQLQSVVAALILCTLGFLTWSQCHIYQDLETLWNDTLKRNPRSWMAHTNLGRLFVKEGRLEEAERQYLAAIAINPEEEDLRYNYGNLLMREGHFAEAETQYRIALQTAPQKAEIHNNLGFSLNKQHRTDEAIGEFQRAIQLKPGDPDAYYNLGTALMARHQVDEAVAAYQKALQLRPDSEMFKKRLQELGAPTN